VAAARRGAWVEFDGVSDDAFDLHKALVLHMDAQQLIHRTLISHDAGWYHVGEPDGGTFRDYSLIFRRFMPELRRSGLTVQAKRRLLVDNPREALLPREVAARADGIARCTSSSTAARFARIAPRMPPRWPRTRTTARSGGSCATRFPTPTRGRCRGVHRARLRHGCAPRVRDCVVDGEAVGGVGYTLQVGRRADLVGDRLLDRARVLGTRADDPRRAGVHRRRVRAHPELRRVYALPFASNPASARVLEKAGFTLEGRLRQAVIKDGQVLDQLVYGRLRSE
jgi:hypothetical protein